MNLTDLIVELLQQGNRVALPGIGTLDPKTEASHLNTADGTFSPSHKSVSISQSTDNVVDIIQQIASKECVGENVAKQIWQNYLDALTDKLRRTSSHTFNGIGTLRRDTAGRFSFETDASYSTAQEPKNPLLNVNTYIPKADSHDPFAAFDQPVEPEPAEEPIPAEQTEPTEPQPIEEPEAAPTVEPEPAIIEEAAPAVEPTPAEEMKPVEEPEQIAVEEQPTETEQTPNTEEKDHMAETIASLRQLDSMPESLDSDTDEDSSKHKSKDKKAKKGKEEKKHKKEKKEKKKKCKLWWLWLLLLLLALAAFGYYYFIHKGNPIPFVKQSAEQTTTESAAQIQTESAQDYVDGDWMDYTSCFTFNTDLIEFSNQDIEATRDEITAFMHDYIAQYTQRRLFSAAEDHMMARISTYAEERLIDILNTDKFFVQRFLYPTDFINEHCHDHLKRIKAYVTQTTIQTELMNLDLLQQMLDEVVAEFGIEPDTPTITVPKAKKPEGHVYRSHITKQSKQGYDIVAGFFKDKAKADRMASNLKSYGCDAYIIDKNHGYYVSMGSAPNLTRAEALRKHIKEWYDGDVSIEQLK